MGEMNKKVCAIELEKTHGLIILLLAIFGSGWSSIAAGFLSKTNSDKAPAIILGLIQIVSTCILVGWFWSMYTGYKIFKNSQ